MKRNWSEQELVEHWTLHHDDLRQMANKSAVGQLGFAVLLKFFQLQSYFPIDPYDVPPICLQHICEQLEIHPKQFLEYDLGGRTAKRHHVEIRVFLGWREHTVCS